MESPRSELGEREKEVCRYSSDFTKDVEPNTKALMLAYFETDEHGWKFNAVRHTAKDSKRENFAAMVKPCLNLVGTMIHVKGQWLKKTRREKRRRRRLATKANKLAMLTTGKSVAAAAASPSASSSATAL